MGVSKRQLGTGSEKRGVGSGGVGLGPQDGKVRSEGDTLELEASSSVTSNPPGGDALARNRGLLVALGFHGLAHAIAEGWSVDEPAQEHALDADHGACG